MTTKSKRTVLVVDDEDSLRSVMKRMLTAAGYEVTVAASGRDAVACFVSTRSFDLLVTDLFMPEMEGDELARQLRLVQPDLKVLYVTGFTDRLFARRQLLWDGEAFLDKPFSRLALLEAASLVLDGQIDTSAAERQASPAKETQPTYPQTLTWQ